MAGYYVRTSEHRKKMSQIKSDVSLATRKKLSEAGKGRPSFWKGKKLSSSHRENLSNALKGRIRSRGSIDKWRESVLKSGNLKGKPKSAHWLEVMKNRRGYKHSQETKLKMSQSKKGRIITPEWRKNISDSLRGVVRSDEYKIKMSKRLKGRVIAPESRKKMSETKILTGVHAGSKNANWKGGLSFEPYSIGWNNKLKESAKDRDGNTCQICGVYSDKLDVHHIDYNKKNNDLLNLISLCKSCHSRTNFNRGQWKELFSNLYV